jgi:hypothetical protein
MPATLLQPGVYIEEWFLDPMPWCRLIEVRIRSFSRIQIL